MTSIISDQTITNEADLQLEAELETIFPESSINESIKEDLEIEKEMKEIFENTETTFSENDIATVTIPESKFEESNTTSQPVETKTNKAFSENETATVTTSESKIEESNTSVQPIETKTNTKEKVIKDPAITISYLAKNIENRTIRTNKDLDAVIEGHWEYKKGLTPKKLQEATLSAQVKDGENSYTDIEILKKNLRKVLVKVKK